SEDESEFKYSNASSKVNYNCFSCSSSGKSTLNLVIKDNIVFSKVTIGGDNTNVLIDNVTIFTNSSSLSFNSATGSVVKVKNSTINGIVSISNLVGNIYFENVDITSSGIGINVTQSTELSGYIRVSIKDSTITSEGSCVYASYYTEINRYEYKKTEAKISIVIDNVVASAPAGVARYKSSSEYVYPYTIK
ncbi:MAG: hypothetical protein K6G38_05680, partial [Gammaproteobacteria bacterium]|nr:hypothetical protein [Gammaproteobacteria bacterium]